MRLRSIGKLLLGFAAAAVLVLGAGMLALKLALDRVPSYQAEIKDWVHRQIGFYIVFSGVEPKFRWYGPELYLDHLELRSKDDRRVLVRAAGGRVAIDLLRLIRNGTLLAGRVELDAPSLTIARLEGNRFAIASEILLEGRSGSADTITLDDLPAGTLAIRGGVVTLQDWNAALPRLTLRGVNLDLARGRDGVALSAQARLPDVLGGRVRVNGSAWGLGNLSSLTWNVAVSAQEMSMSGWGAFLPEYVRRLTSGTGNFDAAARGRAGNLERADLSFAAVGLVAQLTDEPSTRFDRISGALTLAHENDRWTLAGRRLRTVRAGHADPQAEFDVAWRRTDAGALDVRARASYLRAETLLPLAGILPQKDIRDRLSELEPTGEWYDATVEVTRGGAEEVPKMRLQARFRDVGFAPVGRLPGVRGLTGRISGTEAGGRVELDSHGTVIDWPLQFQRPAVLDSLATILYWRRDAAGLLVATSKLAAENRDAAVGALFSWLQPADGSSPILTLVARIGRGDVAAASNYLPRQNIPPRTLEWLNRALVGGRVTHAEAVLRGPIGHFPFRDGSGLFLVRLGLQDATLDYSPDWPRLDEIDADAEFRNEGLTVKSRGARLAGLRIESAEARFADFKTGELRVTGVGHADASQALDWLRATPLDAMAEHVFSSVEAHGPIDAKIDLFFPFKEFDQRRVLVRTSLHGISLNRVGSNVRATDVTGEAEIDGAQVSRADLRGRLLGGPFQMQARVPRRRPATRTQLEFRGTAAGEDLRTALGLPPAVDIGGQTDWRAVLRLTPGPARERSLRMSGSLAGLALGLPAPLGKPPGRPMPSECDVRWPQSGGIEMRISLGSVLRAAVDMDSDGESMRLARAAVRFGTDEAAFSADQVVNVGGTIDQLDLAGWLKLAAPEPGAKPLSAYLHRAAAHVQRLDYLGLSFLDLDVDLDVRAHGSSISVQGPNVAGTIVLPPADDPGQPWQLEFRQLHFVDAPAASADGGAVQEGSSRPAKAAPAGAAPEASAVPALDFHAADLVWDGRRFGDVRAGLRKVDDGIAAPQLTAVSPTFAISAHGEWRGKGAGAGHIEGDLSSTDVQETMRQLGFAELIEAKSGRMDFSFGWAGAPTADALQDAAGHVHFALDDGQILGLKPGAGRLLGLASVAELRRRLALDFSDLTDKGLAFDTIRGGFDLRGGNAYTDDLLVKGPAAEIGLIGRVGLKSRDYDQTAVVTGNLSSSLPLAAFAGGPVIGAAVLVFTQVFKQPLKGLARGYYRITGSWDSPKVERIKSADAGAVETPKADDRRK